MDKSLLKQVVIDQQEEFIKLEFTRREQLSEELLQLVTESKLVKVVLGVRRSGKSSLCADVLRSKRLVYVNFDDERLVGLRTEDLQTLLEVMQEIVPNVEIYFLDEIQNIDSWELFVNRLERSRYNIVLTGSNGKLLGKDLATHLTGRAVSLTLYPLSFSEFLKWRGVDCESKKISEQSSKVKATLSAQLSEYSQLGGFPDVVLGESQMIYLRELFDKIITRDIVQRYKIRDIKIVKELALYLIQNSSQIISYGLLQATFKLSSITTTRKYVQMLQDVFLIHEIRAYSYKLKERSTARRKTYACDLGMMRALWSKPTQDLGAFLETLIFLHLLIDKKEVYFLADRQSEVDFCVVKDGKPCQLIQVCYELSSPKTREREVEALKRFSEMYNVSDLYILTRDTSEKIKIAGKKTINVMPAWEFLLTLTLSP